MNDDVNDLKDSPRGALFAQILWIALVVGGFAAFMDGQAAVSAAYGIAIAGFNRFLSWWHTRRALRLAGDDAGRIVRIVYRCALERFAATVALFAIGFGRLDLLPLPLLVGFIAALIGETAQKFKSK